ncbi:glutamate--tRNA ligase [Bacteroidales bacterium OttesenSCG-928-B11]|nr:glutamate--tRNA ligase [Bacteroidales bacterium OttesenSCG-928-E04]MDL2309046.1 glutamate--tRNA ligase [Bacteroidales bacterium OttesenSCG-928-C03]MDL2312264.1 glutamate--tRNA ligase [Bacteroidales bacterium OttesenSCG-928-B11]
MTTTLKPRVRFAPSPTGPLHIGGVRTALYNYLFAKQHGGTFILRIEDTDQTRFVPGAEEYIIESFEWLGITFDEGVRVGGDFGPYKQSERKPLYQQFAQQLIDSDWAYYAFDTPEQLDEKRKDYEAEKKNFQYDNSTRLSMTNSLSLPKEETERRLASGQPFVIRFKFPADKEILVNDLIRGEVRINSNLLDDKVLFKSDGMPTYHLANIVDDHLMEITHVIRGEEWLPSAPLHVMLYQAFGWDAPSFAHLPLLLKPDGNGKLSKRDGDRLGFPVFPLQWINPETQEISSGYREMGYLPDAVINILSLLGWNPGTEQEILSIDELVKLFSLDKISKSGAKFDPEKAKWFNHQYIQKQPIANLAKSFDHQLKAKGIHASIEQVERAVAMIRERVHFLTEFWDQGYFLFEAPKEYDQQVVKKRWKENTPDQLRQVLAIISSVQPFNKETAHDEVVAAIQRNEWNMGQVMNCLRLSIVGAAKGPDLFDIIDFIGVEEVNARVEQAIDRLCPEN